MATVSEKSFSRPDLIGYSPPQNHDWGLAHHLGGYIGISSGGWHEVTEVICGVSMATRKEQILII